jgi:hypothetical protein
MDELTHYNFRIDAWSPETLPMARLAEYLARLSTMFGYKEHVHFLKVRKGSAIPEIAVDRETAPKVAARLHLVGRPDSPPELARVYQEINRMLRDDNASATLKLKRGSVVVSFPGKKTPLAEEVVVHDQGDLDGIIIRVGGKDDSVPIWVEGEHKIIYKCQTSRDLARQLAAYLFDQPIRVVGNGQWRLLRLYSLPSTRARAGISASTRAQNSSDTFQLAKRCANFQDSSIKSHDGGTREISQVICG